MRHNDDSDVKIFTKSQSDDLFAADDFVSLAEQLDLQRASGNMAKAKKLGEQLAVLTPENEPVKSIMEGKALTPEILYQIRVLMFFAMQTATHMYLHLPMLYSAAVNCMYDKLISDSPEFYEDISDAAEFTFYYLAIRKDTDVEQHIGNAFAMLCLKEGDEQLISLGIKIFKGVTNKVIEKIESLSFENN
ncbi:MAG TPA: hypothetical protein VFD52_06765 [Clostridia bacterium]|nr:hypothetical protein [Clostridia bacterium]